MVDPPLPSHGSISFGYGEAPLVFSLDKGRDVEVGFLKLFICTEYEDLSDMEQEARPIGRAKFDKKVGRWDTIEVMIVVR